MDDFDWVTVRVILRWILRVRLASLTVAELAFDQQQSKKCCSSVTVVTLTEHALELATTAWLLGPI